MAAAERFLRKGPFDLIICTILFDDSKLFDLLRFVKSRPEWRDIPFAGARVLMKALRTESAVKAAAFTSKEFGAVAFLDIADYKVDPERELREAIEALLPK
jgi:hypothetical protein